MNSIPTQSTSKNPFIVYMIWSTTASLTSSFSVSLFFTILQLHLPCPSSNTEGCSLTMEHQCSLLWKFPQLAAWLASLPHFSRSLFKSHPLIMPSLTTLFNILFNSPLLNSLSCLFLPIAFHMYIICVLLYMCVYVCMCV